MYSIKKLSRVAAAVTLMAAATTSHAALTVYSSLSSFTAVTTGGSTDTFDDLATEVIASPLTRSVGAFGYTASATGDLFGAGSASDVWLGGFDSLVAVKIGALTGGVKAIGGLFFATDSDGAFLPGQNLIVTVTDSFGAVSSTPLTGTQLTSFAGFVSNGTIVSLTVQSTTQVNDSFATINNLVLAQAPVPEPATYGMLLAGLGAMAFLRRRKA